MDNDAFESRVLDKLDDLEKSISSLDKNIVGVDHCAVFRKEIEEKLDAIDRKNRAIEVIMSGITASDGPKLEVAKSEAVQLSEKKFEAAIAKLDAKIEAIQKNMKYFDLAKLTFPAVMNNRVLLAAAIGLGYLIIETTWGRVAQYGLQDVLTLILIVLVSILVGWLGKNRGKAIKFIGV